MTTAEASLARRIPGSPPVAGPGPAEQDIAITDSSSPISGAGGRARLYGTAGTHALAAPAANAVWLRITDKVGAAHVLTGSFNHGSSTTITFNGTMGSVVDLTADADGTWLAEGQNGVTCS